ncbi:MAG: aminodeoxychorismate/anthranilate synthase component II [Ignavibacteriales bacterium]|nr:aminodeoxychorismate/anthranilate synthase component II [Ignavibacteriales bacterium]
MILIIDNYDSFTYNLVQYLGELGAEQEVVRNDAVTVDEISRMKPDAIVISPGPCTPTEAGISVEVVQKLHKNIPLLGVCLGHQAIGAAFGGRVVKANKIFHGKTSEILHDGKNVFKKIPSPFTATRYHSLVVERDSLPKELVLTAWTEDGTVMGLRHRKYPVYGVQFHPESIATKHGKQILKNFLSLT